jgi:hypothetical protein
MINFPIPLPFFGFCLPPIIDDKFSDFTSFFGFCLPPIIDDNFSNPNLALYLHPVQGGRLTLDGGSDMAGVGGHGGGRMLRFCYVQGGQAAFQVLLYLGYIPM